MSEFTDALDELAERMRRRALSAKLARIEHYLSLPRADDYGTIKAAVTDTLDCRAGHFEVKAADSATGEVAGYLAVFNNTDLVKDIIQPGAFSKTLADASLFVKEHDSSALYPLL